jgi:hypothetical protein
LDNLFFGLLLKEFVLADIDTESNIEVFFFNPRQEKWENHFQVDSESSLILGKTPIGRVTITCLEMNSQAQIIARRLCISLGLFP